MSYKANKREEAENNPLTLLIRRDQLAAQRRNIQAAVPVNLAIAAIAFLVSVHSQHIRQGLAWFVAVCLANAIRLAQAWPTVSRQVSSAFHP